jgi:hypothetical protein
VEYKLKSRTMKTNNTQLENTTRPANWWKVFYGENQSEPIEAPEGINQAIELFRDLKPDVAIYGVSHMSYVVSEWKDTAIGEE